MEKKKLNFDFNIKGLDDKDLSPENNASKLLANVLAAETKGDPLKMFSWAMDLYNRKPLEIDLSDLDFLKSFIKSTDTLTILAKAQLLLIFE